MPRATRAKAIKQELNEDFDLPHSTANTIADQNASRSMTVPRASSTTIVSSGGRGADLDTEMSDGLAESMAIRDNDQSLNGQFQAVEHHTSHPIASSSSEGISSFGLRARQSNKVVRELESLGLGGLLSLPKLAVVGDQSHGKSSLIEALCNISLPRGPDTCTKCPFSITTSAATSDWSCVISLNIKFDSRTWKSLPVTDREDIKFDVTKDKTDLERILRLAQVAILCPSRNAHEILRANDLKAGTELSFSPNIISLNIEGPDLAELSMIDLPGAINVNQDQAMVGLVKQLLEMYLEDQHTVILMAIQASNDVETSTSFGLVKQCGALGRCIGVLTKADTMSKESNQINRTLGRLDSNTPADGWFATKQLSEEEANIEHVSYVQARAKEKAFFATQQPWCNAPPDYKSRFGIPKLQDALSHKLTTHILHEMPSINHRVNRKLEEINVDLAKIPEPSKAPTLTVVAEAQKFTAVVAAYIKATDTQKLFRREFTSKLACIKDALEATQPNVKLGTPGYVHMAIPIDSGNESDDTSPSQVDTQTPSKSRKGNDGRVAGTPIPSRPRAPTSSRKNMKPEHDSGRPTVSIFKLDDFRDAHAAGSASGIPGDMSIDVTSQLTLQTLADWPRLIATGLDDVERAVFNMLEQALQESITRTRRGTQFDTAVGQTSHKLAQHLFTKQREIIYYAVECELYSRTTNSGSGWTMAVQKAKLALESHRRKVRVTEYFDQLSAKTGKTFKPEDRNKRFNDIEWINTNLGADEYANEVKELAKPVAYHNIAVVRISDIISSFLKRGVLHALETDLYDHLLHHLKAHDADHCAWLLAQDPKRELERRALLAEKEKLQQAMEKLEAFSLPS